MFEAIGVIAIMLAVIVFVLAFSAIVAIGPIVWIIYSIIVIILIGFNIYLFYTDDIEKAEFAVGSVLGIAVLTIIAKIIESIANWWYN